MRALVGVLGLYCLVVVGCARHAVVERDAGRVDGDRSVMTRSDTAWKIVREASPAHPVHQDETREEQATAQ